MSITPEGVQAIIQVAQNAANAEELELGKYYTINHPAAGVVHVDLTGEQWHTHPKRRRGSVVVTDVPSFLAYWAKHHDEYSEIYADRQSLSVVAVLNAHGRIDDEAGWGDHRLRLTLRYSDAFKAWADVSGRMMGQVAFAEFIEDHRPDILDPPAADLLELAQHFHATSKVTYRSGSVLKSGERQLSYVEQVEAQAGRNGQITIPDHLTLGLLVFDGAAQADQITARLRYRIDPGGQLGLGVILDELAAKVDGAFAEIVEQVADGVDRPILRGTPAVPLAGKVEK